MESFLTIFLGALLAQVLFRNKFIADKLIGLAKEFHPDFDEKSIAKFEYSILPLFGAIIAYKLTNPASWIEQIVSGFGWCAALESVLKKSKPDEGD